MSKLTEFEVEGILNGQREVLSLILAQFLKEPDSALAKALDERVAFADQQEDPGAVPDPMFAVQAAKIREIKRLVEEARSIRPSAPDQVNGKKV